jgi:hypothetical protein
MEVATMPLMFHLMHKQRGEEVLSKRGWAWNSNKQTTKQVSDEASGSRQGTWKCNDGESMQVGVGDDGGNKWKHASESR